VPTIPISDPGDPRIADYRNVPDPVLLRERGLFVAEGRLVVRALLDEPRHRVRSLLVTPAAFEALAGPLARRSEVAVYTAPLEVLTGVVGFNIHRGCLAIGERSLALRVDEALALAAPARLTVVLEQVADADNVGSVFRSARAFGAGCVLLSPGCCDPLYRKAIRVSIGASLQLPFATFDEWPAGLSAARAAGYELVALTPQSDAEGLASAARRAAAAGSRVALMLGHEGSGLSDAALARSDRRVRIEMQSGVDSVNVATAAAIAMYGFSTSGRLR
jgi:tRNA G18 (ribose-2'-O)-methylase SpoU